MSITFSKGFSFSHPPVNLPHQSYAKGHASVRGNPRMCILRSEQPGHNNKEAPHKSGVLPCLVRRKGFEPLTFWSVARRSIQLS